MPGVVFPRQGLLQAIKLSVNVQNLLWREKFPDEKCVQACLS